MSNSWMKEAERFMSRPSSMPGLSEFEPLKNAEISADDIKLMSDSELNNLLAGEGADGFVGLGVRQAIMSEQHRRELERASKPNWLTLLGLVMALLSLLVACLSWLWPVSR